MNLAPLVVQKFNLDPQPTLNSKTLRKHERKNNSIATRNFLVETRKSVHVIRGDIVTGRALTPKSYLSETDPTRH